MGLFSRIARVLHQPVRPVVVRTPAPAVVPAAALPSLKPGPGIADAVSRGEFQQFLAARRTGSVNLTGLYNVETGQIVFGYLSHHDLAAAKHLILSERPLLLLPGWFGFRFLADLKTGALNISPESTIYRKIPLEYLAGFQSAMEKLLTGEQFSNVTYDRETVLAEQARQRTARLLAERPVEPRPTVATVPSTLREMSALLQNAETDPDFFGKIARALVAHCAIRLGSGENINDIVDQLTRSQGIKFPCFRDSLDVVMVHMLVAAQAVPRLCDRQTISGIFGIN
jgi:hypothetical protein